jgi:hypothetical protein
MIGLPHATSIFVTEKMPNRSRKIPSRMNSNLSIDPPGFANSSEGVEKFGDQSEAAHAE